MHFTYHLTDQLKVEYTQCKPCLSDPSFALCIILSLHSRNVTPSRRTVRRIPAKYLACRRADLANVTGVEGAIKKGFLVWEKPSRTVGCRQTLNCKLPMTRLRRRGPMRLERGNTRIREFIRELSALRARRERDSRAFLTSSFPSSLAINHYDERRVVSISAWGKRANRASIIVANDNDDNDGDRKHEFAGDTRLLPCEIDDRLSDYLYKLHICVGRQIYSTRYITKANARIYIYLRVEFMEEICSA